MMRDSCTPPATVLFLGGLVVLMLGNSHAQAQLVTTFPLRINAGAKPEIGPVVDSSGNTWGVDQYFTTGFFDSTDRCGTTLPPGPHCRIRSFNPARNPAPYGYSIPVPNGEYQVGLQFVETFYTIQGPLL
jgi:Malectin domain